MRGELRMGEKEKKEKLDSDMIQYDLNKTVIFCQKQAEKLDCYKSSVLIHAKTIILEEKTISA